jgi:hypothetical protein
MTPPPPDPGLGPLWCALIVAGVLLIAAVATALLKRTGKW